MIKQILLSILFFLTLTAIVIYVSKITHAFWGDAHFYKSFYIIQTATDCSYPDCIDNNSPLKIRGEIISKKERPLPTGGRINVKINNQVVSTVDNEDGFETLVSHNDLVVGVNKLTIMWRTAGTAYFTKIFEADFVVADECSEGEIGACGPITQLDLASWSLCQQTSSDINPNALLNCTRCLKNQGGIWTAFGCIPTDAGGMVEVIVRIGLLIGGGTATLIILAGSFMLSISQGDPKKTTEAKEMITAAVIGLIFIVFSISILQLIGVQILQIPEFGQ